MEDEMEFERGKQRLREEIKKLGMGGVTGKVGERKRNLRIRFRDLGLDFLRSFERK
jgi:hypothetical protein